MAASLIPCVTVATEASQYDWCKLTMDWLCDTAHRFQAKFPRDGFRSGSGGSFLFVMIFYLDHLHRSPVQRGVFPRVKVWSSVQIKAALMEDKVTRDEYGKLLALDIAYGEEHPLEPRNDDTLGLTFPGVTEPQLNAVVTKVLDQVITQLTPRLETLVEGMVGKAFSGLVTKMTGMGVLKLLMIFLQLEATKQTPGVRDRGRKTKWEG